MTHPLLTLIENVDPGDTRAMDELDARVWCYTHGKEYEGHKIAPDRLYMRIFVKNDPMSHISNYITTMFFTRSRGSLKEIRPDNCGIRIYQISKKKFVAWMFFDWEKPESRTTASDKQFPTEELAELHAIIQAWEHERAQG